MTDPRPLFRHEPQNEQEVVCLFGAVAHLLDFAFVIERVQTPFPDCTVRTDTGKKLRIEFELYSRQFKEHRHDQSKCDLLICWQDDWGKWPDGFVLELRRVVAEKCSWIIEDNRDKPLGVPWCKDTFFKRCDENGLSEEQVDQVRVIIEFAERESLGPTWKDTPTGTFVVGDHQQFFKVHADGQIALSFLHLDAGGRFPELFRRLNMALQAEQFQQGDETRKKAREGVRKNVLGTFFQDREQLRAFLEVWKWFAAERSS